MTQNAKKKAVGGRRIHLSSSMLFYPINKKKRRKVIYHYNQIETDE